MQEPVITKVDPNDVRLPDFQREEVRRVVRQMHTKFVPGAFGIPVVWQNGTGLLALDGQQRLQYAREAGESDVTVQVVDGDEQEAARIYYTINAGRANLTPFDIYVSQVAAHDPLALQMRDILKKYDIDLSEHRSRTAAFRDIHRRGILDKTLRIVSSAWGMKEDGALHYNFLYGLARYVETVREPTLVKLPDALRPYSPVLIRTWAEAKHNEGRGPVRVMITKKVRMYYNAYMREQRAAEST